jgi:hypothetical protein
VIAGVDRFGDRVRCSWRPAALIAEITAASFHDMGFTPATPIHAGEGHRHRGVYPA